MNWSMVMVVTKTVNVVAKIITIVLIDASSILMYIVYSIDLR